MNERRWHGMNWCSKPKRLGIYLRDGFCCVYCGLAVEDGIKLTIDHIIPRAHGGSNAWKNLVTSCKPCNDSRGAKSVYEFVARRFSQALRATIFRRMDRFIHRSQKKYVKQARAILRNRTLKEYINGQKEVSQTVR